MKNKIGYMVIMEYKGKHEIFDYKIYTLLGAKRIIEGFCKKNWPTTKFYIQSVEISKSLR